MTTSDILTIITFALGLLVSGVFFRMQQVTDFNRLKEEITNLKNIVSNLDGSIISSFKKTDALAQDVSVKNKRIENQLAITNSELTIIKTSVDVTEQIKLHDSMVEMRTSLDTLKGEIFSLGPKITDTIVIEQKKLIASVQSEFIEHTEKSRHVLENALQAKLVTLIPDQRGQKEALEVIMDLMKHTLNSMGAFQTAAISQRAEDAVRQAEKNIIKEVERVAENVKTVKEILPALPPPSS
jgi:hypothetical protein